ncbi:MAG: transposase, partial [Deltaproteobacteria bacterium]|nr:transposase [Deltaproteobacteria bacterium]
MTCSMSRKGDCWDNAVAESFFGKLKTERVFFADYRTRDEARRDIVDYVDYIEMFYNSRRRHSYLGNISPRRFEEMRQAQNAA